MTPQEFIVRLDKHKKEGLHLIDRILPVKVGTMAEEHFKQNFLKGGFVNGGLHRWKPAKRLLRPKPGAANNSPTLMSPRTRLFRATKHVTYVAQTNIRNKTPYAAVHNEGLRAGRGKGFQMPKRQFIGDSKELNAEIEKTIDNEIEKILKQ